MVAAGAVEGEAADQSGVAVDGEVVAAGDDEDVAPGVFGSDADLVVVPAEAAVATDAAEPGVGRFEDRIARRGSGWAGGPPFERGRAPEPRWGRSWL